MTSNNTGCQIASVKSVMTVVKNSLLLDADITVGYVGKFSVADAVTRKSLENLWVTQVRQSAIIYLAFEKM